jgi:hypothetical protein
VSRLVHEFAWLIVAALLAPGIAMGAECATWGDCPNAGQEPVSSMSTDEARSSEGTAAWNAAGREDTRTTECIAGPLSSTNRPGMPQANTRQGGNSLLAPALVLNLAADPLQAIICPAVLGVRR